MTHPDPTDAEAATPPPRWTHTDHTGDHDDLASHATETHGEPHGADDHGEPEGHDDHAHAAEDMDLGPIDWTAWGVGAIGVAVALVMVALLVFTTTTA